MASLHMYTSSQAEPPKLRSRSQKLLGEIAVQSTKTWIYESGMMIWSTSGIIILVLIWDGNGLWWFLNMVTLLFPGPIIFFARVSMRANPMSFWSEPRPKFHTVMTIRFWPTKTTVLLCYQQILGFIVRFISSCCFLLTKLIFITPITSSIYASQTLLKL